MLSKKIGMLFTFLDSALLPQLLNGLYEEGGDEMKAINGFACLCALGLLGGDAMAGASIGKVAFHVALLIVNFVFYLREE